MEYQESSNHPNLVQNDKATKNTSRIILCTQHLKRNLIVALKFIILITKDLLPRVYSHH